MKLNLEPSPNSSLRNGYLNISSNPRNINFNDLPENTHFAVGSYKNLNNIVKEPVEEIIFNFPLNILTPNELIETLEHWKSLLKDGGALKIFFLDIRRVSKFVWENSFDLQQTHNAIFGKNNELKSLIDTNVIRTLAKELNFNIEYITPSDILVSMELIKNA